MNFGAKVPEFDILDLFTAEYERACDKAAGGGLSAEYDLFLPWLFASGVGMEAKTADFGRAENAGVADAPGDGDGVFRPNGLRRELLLYRDMAKER